MSIKRVWVRPTPPPSKNLKRINVAWEQYCDGAIVLDEFKHSFAMWIINDATKDELAELTSHEFDEFKIYK